MPEWMAESLVAYILNFHFGVEAASSRNRVMTDWPASKRLSEIRLKAPLRNEGPVCDECAIALVARPPSSPASR
jgi:hypothetical protein